MLNFWLPLQRLALKPISEIAPGTLFVLQPGSEAESTARVGIVLAVEGASVALSLTPFYGEGSSAGEAIDLGYERGSVLCFVGETGIEANMRSGVARGARRDVHPGEIVLTDQGIGVGVEFNRHNPGSRRFIGVVSIDTWKPLDDRPMVAFFAHWRLRLDLGEREPTYWTPDLRTDHAIAA